MGKIVVENWAEDGEEVSYRLVLLKGHILGESGPHGDSISVRPSGSAPLASWPLVNSRFRALVYLGDGLNTITLSTPTLTTSVRIRYHVRSSQLVVMPVYLVCGGEGRGEFEGDGQCDTSIESAQARIDTALRLVQTIYAEKIKERGYPRKTFLLESDRWESRPVCRVLKSKLDESEARRMSEEELWRYFAVELTSSAELGGARASDTKYVAFLSATRCLGEGVVVGDAALASGGLALLGTGCIHTLPPSLDKLIDRLTDQTPLPPHLQDNSCYRGTYGGCATTTLGSICHEMGHMFNLGHPGSGMMGRGFDNVDRALVEGGGGASPAPSVDLRGGEISLSFTVEQRLEEVAAHARKARPPPPSDDLTRWSPGCAAILAHHPWFNDTPPPPASDITFDNNRGVVKSGEGWLRCVQVRTDSGQVRRSWELKSEVRHLIVPSPSGVHPLPSPLHLVAVNNIGAILATTIS